MVIPIIEGFMSKKKLVIAAAMCLGLAGGVWGGMSLLTKDWTDRQAEFAEALSLRFQQNGAPSKAVADKAANCIATTVVPVAQAAGCPAEGEVLDAMRACSASSQEVQLTFALAAPACVQEALGGQ